MWANPNRQPSSEKKSPAWGSQKDVLEIPGQIYGDISAQVKETQKRVGKVMQDRDIDSRQRAKSLMTGLPPSKDQEIADSLRESIETQRKNPRMQPKSKYAGAKQESRDWQKWWSTQVPAFMPEGDQPSGTWTSADGKKAFEGSVVRISEPSEGTRYVSIKDKKGRTYTLDIKLLSASDQKKLEGMYQPKKTNPSTGGK
jgi:hypothetical protein